MATYIVLAKMTQQGIQTASEIPQRRAAVMKEAEALGITWHNSYLTMGRFDVVFVLDAPDDATLAKFVLQLGKRGTLTTQTLRAFDEDESDAIVGSL